MHWMRPEPVQDAIRRAARCGFDAIMINGEPALYDWSLVKETLVEENVTPLGAVALTDHPGRDLLHPNKPVRVSALAYVSELLEFVAELGGSVVCLGPVAMIGKPAPTASPKDEWRWAIEALRKTGERAGELGLRVAVEPVSRFETYFVNRADQALCLIDEVAVESVGVCLDTYHMNMEESDPLAAIRQAGPRIFDFHIADSNRKPPGQGHLHWHNILGALRSTGYHAHLTAEVVYPRDYSPLGTAPEDESGELESDFYDRVASETASFTRALLHDHFTAPPTAESAPAP